MKNHKSTSATNITYLDYSNTSVEFGIVPDTNIPDSTISILKNNSLIISNEYINTTEYNKKEDPKQDQHFDIK